jgi:hypothetical protein
VYAESRALAFLGPAADLLEARACFTSYIRNTPNLVDSIG